MPWYTRPCLEWLVTLPLKTMSVFEYGCGDSSLWYAVNSLVYWGVDSNPEWMFFPEHQMLETDKEKYIRAPFMAFDLIIIDGIYRDDCTEHALNNFEQEDVEPHWPKTRELTKDLELIGMFKEPDHPHWKTAVWRNT